MKNNAGKIIGFVFGMAGSLVLFKTVFLPRIAPSDELAPGMVLILAFIAGLICAFVGSLIQRKATRGKANT